MYRAPVPDFGGLGFGGGLAEEKRHQGFSVKGEQGPEIAHTAESGGADDGDHNKDHADTKTRNFEKSRGQYHENAVKPQGIRKFYAGEGKGGQQCDRGVKQDFDGSPVHADGCIADEKTAYDGEGSGKTAGVQRGGIFKEIQ